MINPLRVLQVGLSSPVSAVRHQEETFLHLLFPTSLGSIPCTGHNTKHCSPKLSFKQKTGAVSCRSRVTHAECCLGKLLKLQVWFCIKHICAFVFPWGTMTFTWNSGSAGLLLSSQTSSDGTRAGQWKLTATWWQRLDAIMTFLAPKNALCMLILCPRWLSRLFLASSLIIIHIYRQIKDSNLNIY